MEDYETSTLPLFGGNTSSPTSRFSINNVIIFLTCVMVLITTISAFVPSPTSAGVFFIFCIILICSSHLALIFWYRVGDLDPKFKMLIYFNAVTLILLCICANIYFHRSSY